jgi:hypothetical protein
VSVSGLNDQELLARILAKTCEYLDFPAVVGHETPLLDHLARDFSAAGFTTERPKNLCVIGLGKPGPVFIVHADRHGALITQGGQAIFAAHACPNDKIAGNRPLTASDAAALNERYGRSDVFAYDPVSGGRIAYGQVSSVALDDQHRAVLTLADLPSLPAGAPLAFARRLERSASGFIAGHLDNVITLAALRIAAEQGLGGTIVVTAEEEIGRSADHVLGWAQAGGMEPGSNLIVCDTSPFDDGAAALAGAVILRRRDGLSSFNAEQVSKLESAASAAGAPIIFKDSFIERENDARSRRGEATKSMGLTELGRITAASKGRYAGATLQLPTFDHQAGRESTTPRAVTAYARTLLALQ